MGWKILAPYLVLSALLALAGSYLVTNLVTGSLQERFNNQLIESSRVASDSIARRERQQLSVVRAISFTEGVQEAVDSGDTTLLKRLIEPLAANSRAEVVVIFDRSGRQLLASQLSDPKGFAYSPLSDTGFANNAVVRRVLSGTSDELGDKYSGITDSANPTFFSGGPLVGDRGVVGGVFVGTPVSSLVAAMKAESLTDISVYGLDGQLLGTSFPGDESEDSLAGSAPVGTKAGQVALAPHTLFGREFQFLGAPLTLRGQPVGYVSVALPTAYIATAGNDARWQMTLLFAGATVAVLLIGFFLARRLTDPLRRLVRTARAVTGGDLTARSAVGGRDEIGELARNFDAMTEKLQRQHLQTIAALASAIDARDPYTAGHSMRVGLLAADLGKSMGLPDTEVQHLQIGGYLHDIGKIGVRDSVLLKKGKLTPKERAMIEQHPSIGLEILKPVDLAPEVVAIVGGHHEKLNGTGYPRKLEEGDITIFPRIATVADIYDALTTHRPYRVAMSVDEAMALLDNEAERGLIDYQVVRTLRHIVHRWELRRAEDPLLTGFSLTGNVLQGAA